jgi:hypothetical protein
MKHTSQGFQMLYLRCIITTVVRDYRVTMTTVGRDYRVTMAKVFRDYRATQPRKHYRG